MKHLAVASVLVVIVTLLVILLLTSTNLLPGLASEEGAFVDQMFRAQIYVIAFIFSLIVVLVLYSVVVFRQKPGDEGEGQYITGNTALEIGWTLVPLVIVIIFATWGALHLAEVTAGEEGELVVEVTGFQFGWRFDYPDAGVSSDELWLPLNRQVLFRITSRDVIHSFWVPEFRLKQDAVPGRWTELRVKPTETGDYRLRCAELCGYAHAAMISRVVVVEPAAFEAWLQGMSDAAPGDVASLDAEAVAAVFRGGVEEIGFVTRARVGDKTLMDALLPATDALAAARSQGVPTMFAAAAAAAAQGAEATGPMRARFGRAKNLGERSVGPRDAGAASMACIFQAFAKTLK